MNTIDAALCELCRAEEELAGEFVKAAERHAAEHELFYACRRFAEQCHAHADALQPYATEPDAELPPAPLIETLRRLYLEAHEVAFDWIVTQQLAQATRNEELLALVSELQQETQHQIASIETQVKASSPQALLVGTGD